MKSRRYLIFALLIIPLNTYYRKTSQDNWHKATGIGIGFNARITYEKK